MSFQEFVDWALAQGSVAKYNDGQFKGECVSLVNQYCWRVLSIPADAWGHAKDWGKNTIQREYFDVLAKGTPIEEGDILVYGESFGGGLGHIEIALDNKKAIFQNRNISGKVGTGNILPGYYAILRAKNRLVTLNVKEEDMKFTKEQFLVAADAVGTQLGKDFNFDQDLTMDQFVQLFDSQAPKITKEMESEVADGVTGINNVIGWDGYNSPFVGQKVVTHYPKMVKQWTEYRANSRAAQVDRNAVIEYLTKNLK